MISCVRTHLNGTGNPGNSKEPIKDQRHGTETGHVRGKFVFTEPGPQALKDLRSYDARIPKIAGLKAARSINILQNLGIKETDMDFRYAVREMKASNPCDRRMHVARRKQEKALWL